MEGLNNVIVEGMFKLQNALYPYVDELVMPDINRLIITKADEVGAIGLKFKLKVYKTRVSIDIMRKDESLIDTIHLKVSKNKRLYLPVKNPPKVGMSLSSFEKAFRPGVFDVSDECVDKVLEYIDSWKGYTKAKLKHYKFEPKIIDRNIVIKVYKDYVEYDTFSCSI